MNKGKKDFPRSEISDLKQQLRNSKQEIERLKRIIKRMNSDIKTANSAFNESTSFIDAKLAEMPVDTIVKYLSGNNPKKMKELEDEHKDRLVELEKKWKCHKCETGVMHLTVIGQFDGTKRYFRHCSAKCGNRTPLKIYSTEVEKDCIKSKGD
jgi:chromosome segregation ATPase